MRKLILVEYDLCAIKQASENTLMLFFQIMFS